MFNFFAVNQANYSSSILGGPPPTQDKYKNNTKISITFEEIHNNNNQEATQKIIEFPLTGKVFELIQKYKQEINDNSNTVKFFMFNNKVLNISESLIEAHLYNGCKIMVINMNNK